MTTVFCAECGKGFEPDIDHVRVDAETFRIADRNDEDFYMFHVDCWRNISGEWSDPA